VNRAGFLGHSIISKKIRLANWGQITPAKLQSQRTHVISDIRESISAGTLRPRTQLKQRDLAGELIAECSRYLYP
jgi:hypothetical protein